MYTETRESKDRYCSPDLEFIRIINEANKRDLQQIQAMQTESISTRIFKIAHPVIPEPSILETMKVFDVFERYERPFNEHEAADYRERVRESKTWR